MIELNTRLAAFAEYYNTRRPHRALRGRTPLEAYTAQPAARPALRPLPAPLTVHHGVVTAHGAIQVGYYHVYVGRRRCGTPMTALKDGNHIAVFTGNHLVRVLDADPTRRYQSIKQDQLTD